MAERRRFNQTVSLKDRLAAFSQDALAKASLLPAGPERDDLLKRASCADIASHIDDWANSPLQPPK